MKPKSIPSLHYEYILFKPLTMLIDMSERQYLFISIPVFMHSDVMSDPVIASKPGMASVTNK